MKEKGSFVEMKNYFLFGNIFVSLSIPRNVCFSKNENIKGELSTEKMTLLR